MLIQTCVQLGLLSEATGMQREASTKVILDGRQVENRVALTLIRGIVTVGGLASATKL